MKIFEFLHILCNVIIIYIFPFYLQYKICIINKYKKNKIIIINYI